MSSKRRIVYLTGTRADFGLMRATLGLIASHPDLQLELVVTGMHLSGEHGRTVDEVRASGLPICAELPFDVLTRSGGSMATGIADCLRGMTAILERERPDALLLLGDRGEMMAGALAALHVGVPAVHIHGGELSGTVDEPVRHAISKLAAYHFTATPKARERLLRMGEADDRIFVTGAPGLDGLRRLGDVPREQTEPRMGGGPFVLVVFHPVVQQADLARAQTEALVDALQRVGLPVLWIEPNADAGSLEVLAALAAAQLPVGSVRLSHLPRDRFAAAMRHCAVMAGNSSSGIIEAATFGTPVVNIGDRQRLRERGPNVIDAAADAAAIEQALRAQLTHGPWAWDNAWGDGVAGERIAGLLARVPLGPAVLEKINTY